MKQHLTANEIARQARLTVGTIRHHLKAIKAEPVAYADHIAIYSQKTANEILNMKRRGRK